MGEGFRAAYPIHDPQHSLGEFCPGCLSLGDAEMAGISEQSHDLMTKPDGVGIGCFHRREHFLDFFRLSEQMREAALTPFHFNCVVGGVGIGDEQAAEAFAEKLFGGCRGAVGIDPVNGHFLISRIPDEDVLPVLAPVGFIRVNEIAVTHFLDQIFVDRLGMGAGTLFKTKAAGGNEIESEEVAHELLELAVGKLGLVAQIECGGFGGGADRCEREFSFERFEHIAAAAGTPCGLMNPVGHDGAWTKDDVFLKIGCGTG